MTTIQSTLTRILKLSVILTLLILVIGGGIGIAVSGMAGFWSAAIGAGLGLLFCGMTALSVLIASRFSLTAFFGIVMGSWALKLIIFLVAIFLLQRQPWINQYVFYFTTVAAAIGIFVIDAIVVLRSRVPYVEPANPATPEANNTPE